MSIEQWILVLIVISVLLIPVGKKAAPDGTRWAGVHRLEDGIVVILLLVFAAMVLGGRIIIH